MSLKWKEIARLVEEAKPLLLDSSVQKIAQVKEIAGGDSFSLMGFGANGPWRLWICLKQDQACWVLAPKDWPLESQPEPSTFVMVLRKFALGKKIIGLEQLPGERVLLCHLEGGLSLLWELPPKRSNFLLVENWDTATRTGKCIQSYRQVSLLPGALVKLREAPAVTSDEEREFDAETGEPLAFHRAVAAHYWEAIQETGFQSYKRLWRQAWKSQTKKLQTAIKNAKGDLEEAQEAELFQKRGVALVAHLYELGAKKYPKEKKIVLDEIEIPLDLGKSYADNAEACFKKSKKFNRAVGELAGRLAELEKKMEGYAKVDAKLEAAETDEQLEALTAAFEKEGLAVPEKPLGGAEKKGVEEAKPFLEVRSSDGFTILCGRNQEENRQVTFRESKGSDIWLHLKGAPGAHVVIKAQKNKTVPLNTLLEASQLCLYYSKVRKGKRAEVDYTPRKNVRAIKGTLAEVTYTGNKALYVEADADLLKKILQRT